MIKKLRTKNERYIPNEVYDLLNIKLEEKGNPWPGGTKRFKDVSYETVEKIASILGEDFLYSSINICPTVKEFLEELSDYKNQTNFDGYIVAHTRPDERVTIDAVTTIKADDTIMFLRHADEFDFDDSDPQKLFARFQ